ncbi:ArnT family glycosyltransferase [Solirhodobacter olei]|uniref:ArnT family glycosyltransferase n=1 Tax=Solirhodobacter olei TaxID=2493082 RepID=UPI000FDC4121|nr:glycosyltransferase family 39 protein [Solirhodobacter olei]
MPSDQTLGRIEAPTAPAALPLPPVAWTALVFLALHFALALAIPLVEDEAYYALWATVPSAGYYDHPPMIAWWIAGGEALFGATRLGVRLLPILGFAATTMLVGRIALLAGGNRRTARAAALMLNATLPILALGFTATPDAPSVFFWALTAWAVMEAQAATGPRIETAQWWLLAGLGAGLGVLSKFTNLFLWLGLAGWLVATPRGRRALRRPAVWASAGLALLVLVPMARWNFAHHYAGLTRQFGRLDAAAPPHPTGLLGYVVTTVLLTTPLIFAAACFGALRAKGAARLLLWLSLPLLAYMALHAMHAKVQANWLAPLYPMAAVLAALGLRTRTRRATWIAAGSGLALGALALTLAFRPGVPVFPGRNPPNETKGWTAFTADIANEAHDAKARWIATDAYGLTGSLTWYMTDLPVWSLTGARRYLFRGPLPKALCAEPALLVTVGAPAPASLARFASHGATVPLARRSRGAVIERYTATPVEGLRDCRTRP